MDCSVEHTGAAPHTPSLASSSAAAKQLAGTITLSKRLSFAALDAPYQEKRSVNLRQVT
jgi:hypothetical protein